MKKFLLSILALAFAALAVAAALTPLALIRRVQAEITTNPTTGTVTAGVFDAFYTDGQTDGAKFYADTAVDGSAKSWNKVTWTADPARTYTINGVALNEAEIFAYVKAAADWHKANP